MAGKKPPVKSGLSQPLAVKTPAAKNGVKAGPALVQALPAPAVPEQAAPVSAAETPFQVHRILALQAENIKRLSFVRIRPKGNMVVISGGNGDGKTSVLDSIAWALTGERQIPSQPIRKGQNSARIQVDIGGGLKVERTFTRINGGKEPYMTRLAVYGENRVSYPTPQTVLDKLRSVISFDPLAFIEYNAAKQLETLRQLLVFDVDLNAIEEEKKKAYDERRDAGRDWDSSKARLAALPAPDADLPESAIDTADIARRLESAASDNNGRAETLRRKVQLANDAAAALSRGRSAMDRAAELRKQADEMEKVAGVEADHAKKLANESSAVEVQAEVVTAELAAELQKAQDSNAAIQRREGYRSIERQVADAEKRWEGLDKTVKAKDRERTEAIERAKMPIEKLGIGDDEVLYDGLPFSQASNAEQIRVAVSLAMATNPQLRILLIRDGSLLDHKNLNLIEQMADEHNFQVWLERVETGGKVGIVMEDGEAHGEEAEAGPAK